MSCARPPALLQPSYACSSVAYLCPAALSDNESSGSEDVPAKAKGKQPLAKQEPIDDDDDNDDDNQDSDIGEDEYAHANVPSY